MDKVSELRDAISNLMQGAMDEVARKVQALERRVTELEGEIAARQQRLDSINGEIRTAEERWGFLQRALGR